MNLNNYSIHLNSKDRLNKNDDTNVCRFKISDLINFQSKKYVYLSPQTVIIPPTIYNVTNKNHNLEFLEDTVPSSGPLISNIDIPIGNYNINTFITALTTSLSTTSPYGLTYSGQYDSTTGKLRIFLVPSTLLFTFTWSFQGQNEDLMNFMGFNESYNNTTVPFPALLTPAQPVDSYTSPNPVNFTEASPAIYIRSNITKIDTAYDVSNNKPNGGSSDIMAIIPIYSNGFSQIQWQQMDGIPERRFIINSSQLNNFITFTLTSDDNNELIDLNGFDWQMVIQMNYSDQIMR